MNTKRRAVAGGGVAVEVPPSRLVGWVNRFGGRNEGLRTVVTDGVTVTLVGGDGTGAVMQVPFPPMAVHEREPVEALLDHLAGLGALGIVLVRGGAHSVGVAHGGVVLSSSTDRAYLQGRTAAGGWSQQRYARRRGNQLAASYDSAVSTVSRILRPIAHTLDGLVVGGDRNAIKQVLADAAVSTLNGLPQRFFGDVEEPRRRVLDEIAARSLSVEIIVRSAHDGPG